MKLECWRYEARQQNGHTTKDYVKDWLTNTNFTDRCLLKITEFRENPHKRGICRSHSCGSVDHSLMHAAGESGISAGVLYFSTQLDHWNKLDSH